MTRNETGMRRTLWILLLTLSAAGLLPAPAGAHAGPPFPILVDQRIGPWKVSLWTDPDIGTGVAFVILETPDGQTPGPLPTAVRVSAQPVDGGLAEVSYTAKPKGRAEDRNYFTEVRFDHGGMWRLRVTLDGPDGGSAAAEVEATPDGLLGPGELLLYAAPFLAVGFLWIKAVLRRRKSAPPAPAAPPTP